jgi:hypothetical protein
MPEIKTTLVENIADAGLTKDAENMRLHPQRNIDAIDASIEEVGYGRSLFADETGRLLAGNGTHEVALKRGARAFIVDIEDDNTIVVVRRHGLDERQKTRAGLHDNRTAELAKWDKKAMVRITTERPNQLLLKGIFTEKEQSKLLKAQAYNQPLAPGGLEDDSSVTIGGATGRKESSVVMVQMFFDTETQPVFMRMIRELGRPLGGTSVTDCVDLIVKRAYKEWIEDARPPVNSVEDHVEGALVLSDLDETEITAEVMTSENDPVEIGA